MLLRRRCTMSRPYANSRLSLSLACRCVAPDRPAQVHNALGFCYFNMGKTEGAIEEYERAVTLQPGYVTAWNNLGDAYEKAKDWRQVPVAGSARMRAAHSAGGASRSSAARRWRPLALTPRPWLPAGMRCAPTRRRSATRPTTRLRSSGATSAKRAWSGWACEGEEMGWRRWRGGEWGGRAREQSARLAGGAAG
jgi:hypothetical protein